MRLTFGMYLDGAPWSDKEASVGELQLGPSAMLDLLEKQLGLGGPKVHPAARINQYLQRLEACDRGDSWWHRSLGADGWSTAKQLLVWRDELIAAGWDGQAEASDSPRLRALAELERVDPPLASGRADRLREVARQLEPASSVAIADIRLAEPLELLPSIWQKLLGQLKGKGVTIEPVGDLRFPSRPSNLASIQSIFSGATDAAAISDKDDSLVLVTAMDEWEAAENLALWLAADPEANKDVTIICGEDTDLLDQALHRHGLPQLGRSESSHWRASLQVLPLVLANAWTPVDIHRLVELLSLPMAPVPGYAAGHLFRALREEPGVGGDAWRQALEAIAVDHRTRAVKKGKANPQKDAAAFVARLDAWLSTDRYLPDSGIPEDKLKQRCQWVIDWLAWRIEDEPMMAEAVSHAREMQKLVRGKENIPRIKVERMLDSVIGTGAKAPDRLEQAAAWRVVNHPGQITRPAKTVIWWGFAEPSLKPSVYWSESERAGLLKFGIEMENSRTRRRLEARAWKQGFSRAEDNFIMFFPGQSRGEPANHHPFWDEIHNAAVKAAPDRPEEAVMACLTRESAKLNDEGRWRLSGRAASPAKAVRSEPAELIAVHTIPGDPVFAPASLSYTQMSALLGCPMQWALKYHAGLNVPDTLAVPTGNQMIGTFCHRIIQELYAEPVRQWPPVEAEAKAGELYDSLVGSMASELLLDGNELENKRYRLAIVNAVKQLVGAIDRLGLTVEKAEAWLEGDLDGVKFRGKADLLLRDKQGHPFVLDLKWSNSSRYKKEEVEEGSALQLACYAWMMGSVDGESWAHGGYFMLAQGELISASALLREEALCSAYSLPEIWEMGVACSKERLQALNSGQLEAGGVTELLRQAREDLSADQVRALTKSESCRRGLLYQRPSCGFCDFALLCGMAGGRS